MLLGAWFLGAGVKSIGLNGSVVWPPRFGRSNFEKLKRTAPSARTHAIGASPALSPAWSCHSLCSVPWSFVPR
jgi:hypothetical protein